MSEKREFTGVFIPAHIWISRDLIPAEKMILGEIDALSKTTGWCNASRKHFAEWLQCTVQNVTYYFEKLENLGFIEVNKVPGYRNKIRIIQDRFYIQGGVNGTDGGGKLDLPPGVNGTDGGGKRDLPEIKGKYNNKRKEEIEIIRLSENGKTEVTLHTPDQIENTFLHVVETVSLEAEKPNSKTCSAGPDENEETPASQDAGTLKAECFSNNPPPIFLNPELQRRYNGTAPTNGKARKSPAENRTAQICAEIKTPEVLDFFHAIRDAWSEWTDYKRREKKGAYKTAKTEAATITALARTVNYDPAAGRAAIEHSIAQTYAGIYPPKDAAPAKPTAARYSLEDHPTANTPEELRAELSRFYGAHKSEALLDEAQRFAETNYGPERLKSIVTDFCGNRVAKGRQAETFGQHHAALGLWLKRQKGFDMKNEIGYQYAGPQGKPQLRSAAPVKYSID
jgi:hypothetical protein